MTKEGCSVGTSVFLDQKMFNIAIVYSFEWGLREWDVEVMGPVITFHVRNPKIIAHA